MSHAVLFAGALGLVALAFGQGAAVFLARALCIAPLVLIALVVADKMTQGRLSDAIVPHGRYCYSDCP